ELRTSTPPPFRSLAPVRGARWFGKIPRTAGTNLMSEQPLVEPAPPTTPLPPVTLLPPTLAPTASAEPTEGGTLLTHGLTSTPGTQPHEPRPVGGLGRYEVHGEIGRGGMGAVLRGRDPTLGRNLAIKVLLGGHQGNPDVVRRFHEEAQIGGQLQHPGLVPVY